MTRDVTLADVVETGVEASLEHLHTCLPAKVVRWDPKKRQVDVQPLVMQAREGEDGGRVAAALPVVVNCPVVFPGGRRWGFYAPLEVGDTGLVVFAQSSIDKWLQRGDLVDPVHDHRHNLSDGVFLPGCWPFGGPGAPYSPADRAYFGHPAGTRVEVTGDTVELGGPGGPGVARAGDSVSVPASEILLAIATGADATGSVTSGSGTVKAVD